MEPGLAPGFFVLGDAFTSAADDLTGCQQHFSLARLEQGAEDAVGGTGGGGFDAGEVEQAGAQRAGADRLPAIAVIAAATSGARHEWLRQPDQEERQRFTVALLIRLSWKWWAMTDSNRRHLRCKRSALPTELIALPARIYALPAGRAREKPAWRRLPHLAAATMAHFVCAALDSPDASAYPPPTLRRPETDASKRGCSSVG